MGTSRRSPQQRRAGMARRVVGAAACLALSALVSSSPAFAIVGGREAPDTPEAASAVMVLTSTSGMCTGVVVARDAVLTAGHCVAGVAQNLVHFRDAGGQPVLVAVAERAVHPGYVADGPRARARSIDLALLRTRTPLPDRFIAATLSAAAPRAATEIGLGGYGATRMRDRHSLGRFRRATLSVVEPYGPSRILLWLQTAQDRTRAGGCNGDSGGPITDGAGVVALAAWVKDACGGLTQGILLGPQRDWIAQVLRGWGSNARWVP